MIPQNTIAIIPCYNESESIAATINHLLECEPNIRAVVIDDGSSDNSASLIRNLHDPRITVIELPFNSGIGTAVQTGLLYALRSGANYAVKFDGDGQHLPEEIASLTRVLETGEADMAAGSRFLVAEDGGFKSTFLRRVGIKLFQWLTKLLTGKTITDSTSGFRAYNRQALEFAAHYYPAFDYPEPEESILFLRNGFRIKEVPCKMAPRSGGTSSIRPHKAIYYMLKVSLAVLMEGIRRPARQRCH